MIAQIKNAIHRCHDTLVQDALGAAALIVMLIVSLHLPGMI